MLSFLLLAVLVVCSSLVCLLFQTEASLPRGENGLRVILMCEVPSNAVLAEEFLSRCDGYSIGSNDLTQLILGIDRLALCGVFFAHAVHCRSRL